MKVVGGVLNYCASCDEEDFFQQDVDDQKEWMLGFLRSSLIAAFHDCGIDCTQLDLLGEFVRERQFTSVFLGPKSSSGKRSAQVRCEQGFETCEVYVAITEGLEEIEKVHLTTTTPSEFAFNIFLKELSWTSYNKLELATSLGDSYAIDLDRANERP
ncbi:MAG: hypothetical protein OEM64_07575 [Gammaproteobacteria bacterium]|nr:hypothetical protein [Gammaproteobacteria bacterium]MDH3416149.1 hypothetical protein [Gammaproteobacteria bacterium]